MSPSNEPGENSLLTLALRVLEHPVWTEDDDLVLEVPRLLPGAVPDHLRHLLPIPPHCTVIGSALFSGMDGTESVVAVDSDADVESVVASWDRQLRPVGWVDVPPIDAETMNVTTLRRAVYVRRGDERQVTVDVWRASTGASHVRVVVGSLEHDPDTVIFGHYLWSTVTELRPPTEGRFKVVDESGTIWFRPTMSAGFYSKRPLQEVYEGLAAQLEALGWHRSDETQGDQACQGRWVVIEENGVENITYLRVQRGLDDFVSIAFEYGPGVDDAWGDREKRGRFR